MDGPGANDGLLVISGRPDSGKSQPARQGWSWGMKRRIANVECRMNWRDSSFAIRNSPFARPGPAALEGCREMKQDCKLAGDRAWL